MVIGYRLLVIDIFELTNTLRFQQLTYNIYNL